MVSSGKIRTGWRTILMESDSGRRMRSRRGLVSGWTLISVCEAESCIHCFRQVGRDDTYLPETELTPRASKLLNVTAEQVEKQYMDLAIERKIILKQMEDQTQIYAASFYYMEANTATMLKRLNVSYDVSDAEIEQRIRGDRKEKRHDVG